MSIDSELDAWEAALEPVLVDAITVWAKRAAELSLPTLTADALPPDPSASQPADRDWVDAFNTLVVPVLSVLAANQTWRVLRRRGVDASQWAGVDRAPQIPFPVHWLAGLSDEQRDGLVTDFAKLSRAVEKHVSIDKGARVVLADEQWSQAIRQHFDTVSNRVVGMPDAVFATIAKELSTGIGDAESPQQLRNRVHTILTATGHDSVIRNRAATIARTEAAAAYNAAAIRAMRIEETVNGEKLQKVWVATMDERTRDTHFAADGQRVDSDQSFTVGGVPLTQPGDPSGPAEEVINCRCSVAVLGEDEPLPAELDRQTEINGESRHRDGTQADEIGRRRRGGVTRARDDSAGVGMVAAADDKETAMRRAFSGVLAPIGKPTGDGRIINTEAAIGFREFPLPLMFQKQTSEGHDQSVIVGRIDEARMDGDEITCNGVLFDSDEAAEAATLLDEKVIRPSVDLCDMVAEYVLLDADGNELSVDEEGELSGEPESEMMVVNEATVMAATLVSKPAFGEAKIELGDELADDPGESAETLVAAATAEVSELLSADVFTAEFDEPTALTVTEDGRVFGHLATWGTCHVGMSDRCVTPPASATSYSHFHTSTVETSSGPLAVGRLTVGTGHAGAKDKAVAATAHYDNTGSCWAFVRAFEDEHGIAVAGVVNPNADDDMVAAGASAPLSGDWRRIGGNLELVAALSVNTPGFPVPRTFANRSGASMSLVAAGALSPADNVDNAFLSKVIESTIDQYEARKDRERRSLEAAQIRQRIEVRLADKRRLEADAILASIRNRRAEARSL